MLLGVVKRGLWLGEMVVHVAGDVALEAAECFFLGEALFHASRDVVAGSWVADHAGDDDVPQRRVRVAIAAPVESVSLVFATAGIDGCDTAEMSEAGFVAELFGIVAGCDEQCAGDVGADTDERRELGRGLGDKDLEDGVDAGDFFFEREGAAGE